MLSDLPIYYDTCLGELVLLCLSASQLLVDLLQRVSLNDGPLVVSETILQQFVKGVKKKNIPLSVLPEIPKLAHLFLLHNSFMLLLQLLHLKGQVVCSPRLIRQLTV